MHKPLDGLLVVSIEQAVAAPYCSSRLADAGARVIKIERADGDFARGYDKAAKGLSTAISSGSTAASRASSPTSSSRMKRRCCTASSSGRMYSFRTSPRVRRLARASVPKLCESGFRG